MKPARWPAFPGLACVVSRARLSGGILDTNRLERPTGPKGTFNAVEGVFNPQKAVK